MSAACGEVARRVADGDGFLIVMPAFFPLFYNSFFFFCGCLQNILQKKKIIAASLKKGKMCGTSSSLNSSEAQDLSGAPALLGLWLLRKQSCSRARGRTCRRLGPKLQHLAGLWSTLRTARGDTGQDSRTGISWGTFFNNMLRTGT